ncbi:hypothetical protein DID88_003535 [Monilinia fructigena]|uniref:Uncharacterized protein n=1 Tax=Monilinia fructigena TaxID=38457 RepID=A0A395IUE7_9HELO|nr:hypothetical protein DID88_003535 [Monilinia fructigena]
MKEITDPPSSEGILTERHQNSWGTQGRLLVLADNESDIPNLQATSVSTSAYLPDHDHEKLWDVEEGGFENEDPPIEQETLASIGSEELGDGSVPQQDHDVDQPEQQQHEEAPEEAVWEDDKNHHMMDGGKRKRTYQDKTNEIHSFEDSIPDTNSKDDNNPQPAKRRKPQLLPLDDASALSPKYNRKCRLRQRHSRSLPLTTQHEMNNGQSRNNCNHLLSFRNNDYSYASQTFRNSGDMIESVSIAEYHEWPLQGLIKCAMIENETTYKNLFTVGSCSRALSCFYPFQKLGF